MRKSKPKKRYILPDPKFQDTLVSKFVNYLMVDGKEEYCLFNIFYAGYCFIAEKRTSEKMDLKLGKKR